MFNKFYKGNFQCKYFHLKLKIWSINPIVEIFKVQIDICWKNNVIDFIIFKNVPMTFSNKAPIYNVPTNI